MTITDTNIKKNIPANGPTGLKGHSTDNDKQYRCFFEKYYGRTTIAGHTIPVMWLC